LLRLSYEKEKEMNDNILTGIQAIQAILAPALGISATALLLLGMHNRYAMLINRIRLLNEEKRKYYIKIADNKEPGPHEQLRYASITNQIQKLFSRSKELRNAILYVQGSIMLFVITSVLISVNIFYTSKLLQMLPLFVFSAGMVLVLISIIYSAADVTKSFRVTEIEVKADI
jgi:hypothetical protein